jgi:hypothetical protein
VIASYEHSSLFGLVISNEGKKRFLTLTPERNSSRPVSPFLDQRLVELPTGPGVDGGPALLAVVLKQIER